MPRSMFVFKKGVVWEFRRGGAALLGRQPPRRSGQARWRRL